MDSIDIQKRIRRWVESRLGIAAMAPRERAMRMLEESLELAQAIGVGPSAALTLCAHVYLKPPGNVRQELGGAALTLLACADGCGEVLSQCADRELNRIEIASPEKFRKRQAENAANGVGEPMETQESE